MVAQISIFDLLESMPEQAEQKQPEQKAQQPEQAAETSNGITVTYNQELNGIEISFQDKPGADIRDALKAAGFRWHNAKKLWYAKSTADRLELADRLTGQGQQIPAAEPEALIIPPAKFVDGGGLYDGWEGGNNKKWSTDQELKALLMSDFRKAGISASIRFGRGGYSTSLTVTIRIRPEDIAPFEQFAESYNIGLSGWLYYTDETGKIKDIYADRFWGMTGTEREEMQDNITRTAYKMSVDHLRDGHPEALTKDAYKKYETVKAIVNSYNRDCSNGMVDYFDRDIYDYYAFKIA